MTSDTGLVLVTGGSGFIAGHIILQLLDHGHPVRSTLRSLGKEDEVRRVLAGAGMRDGAALEFVQADLTADNGWADALRGVDHVLHVASPVRLGRVRNEDDVILPARDGALRVLRAARDAGIGRVVLTSAFHAIGFGHPRTDHVFTDDDWSIIDGPGIDAYGKSKILAERAAWDFVRTDGRGLELTTILPVAVMGPVMGRGISGANHIVQSMLDGSMRAAPNLAVPIVDVRDVAAAHLAAMTATDAAGQRFLISTGEPAIAMVAIAQILREHLGEAARAVPTRTLPDVVVRVAARFRPEYRSAAAELGFVKQTSNEKARRILGIAPRPARQAIVAAGESMIASGLVSH